MVPGRPFCSEYIANELHSNFRAQNRKSASMRGPEGPFCAWEEPACWDATGWGLLLWKGWKPLQGGPPGKWHSPSEQIQFLSHHRSSSSNHFKSANCSIITKPWLPCPNPIWRKRNVDGFLRSNQTNTLILGLLRVREVLRYYQNQTNLLKRKEGKSFKQTKAFLLLC